MVGNKQDKIKSIKAQQLLDCKARPIVEVTVRTESGGIGRGAAPTGTSVGKHEPFVLRDGDPSRYNGLGVLTAVENVNKILGPALAGMNVFDQHAIDAKMLMLDGTQNMTMLGGNAICSISIAVMRAAAASCDLPLYQYIAGGKIKTVPVPCFNIVNGKRSENRQDLVNEYLIVPHGAGNINLAVQMAVDVYLKLKELLTAYLGKEPAIAGSCGYEAPSPDPSLVLGLLKRAVVACGYDGRIAFALDLAASDVYDSETKTYPFKTERISASDLIDHLNDLTQMFDLVFIEDPFDEDDWDSHRRATQEISRTIILGDDLTVTNVERLRKAHEIRAIDGFIFKPNQAGTITEAMKAHAFAKEKGMIVVPSGRSGGVLSDVMMDFSVGFDAPFQKNGAPRSGERIEKLNFLMRVNEHCGGQLHDVKHLLRFETIC